MKLAPIFQSNMVLQRDTEVVLFGEATAQETITVSLFRQGIRIYHQETTVNIGKFQVTLPPQKAGDDYTLQANEVIFNNIAFGEVWLLGGQSNMEFLLKWDAEREAVQKAIEAGNQEPDIRYYECPKVSYEGQLDVEDHSQEGVWRTGNSYEDARLFSAVGFYFARFLRESLGDIPVGLIGCTWGGSSAACWVGKEYLTGDLQGYADLAHQSDGSDLEADFTTFRKNREQELSPARRQMLDRMMEHVITQPMHFELPEEQLAFFRRTKYAPFSQFRPAGLFYTMLRPVVPYSIRGFLWYQGEEDCLTPHLNYASLMRALVRCWRDEWHQELPFIFAQLPIYHNQGGFNGLDYVPIRRRQEEASHTIAKAAMVVTLDKGLPYEIHPKEKCPIGERMARQALAMVYGIPVHAESPYVQDVTKQQGTAVIQLCLDSKESSLVLLTNEADIPGFESGVHTSWKDAFGVSVNGIDRGDYEAITREGQLIFNIPELKPFDLVTIEYGQKDSFPVCLYDSVGLPVRPFTVQC